MNENDLKRLEGVFLDRVPQGRAERWSGKKAGEAIAHGSDAERILIFPICGPVVRIDNETMAVRFNRFGFTSSRHPGEIYMIAVYPGDDTYRRIVQQSVMMIPHRNTKGVAQRIEEKPAAVSNCHCGIRLFERPLPQQPGSRRRRQYGARDKKKEEAFHCAISPALSGTTSIGPISIFCPRFTVRS